jgi:hypothetical protein
MYVFMVTVYIVMCKVKLAMGTLGSGLNDEKGMEWDVGDGVCEERVRVSD